jgi:hypothetical protein
VLTTLLEAPEGERNDMLFWAAKVIGAMHYGGTLGDLEAAIATLQDAARRIGLRDGEIGDATCGTICSGLSAAVGA